MNPKISLPIIVVSLLAACSTAEQCGNTTYDPTKYVCWHSTYLCPYTNGSPLSYCNGACYSPFMYHCDKGTLYLNTIITTPVQLTISNPSIPDLDGFPVHACSQKFNTGKLGLTCTYCPEDVVPDCPNSTTTVVYPEGGMSAIVPGGQQWYIDPAGALAFTQPHSAYIPPGSQTEGFQAYESGALVNLESPWGWIACRTQEWPGTGSLFYVSQQKGPELGEECYGVDILVSQSPAGFAVWEYT